MSLLDVAASDLRSILEGDVEGFSLPITVTNPDGASAVLRGSAADIGSEIDPDTGQMVSGRTVHVSLSLAALAEAGLGQPRGIADEERKPWTVGFQLPSAAAPQNFVVERTMPDRLGIIVCFCKPYLP